MKTPEQARAELHSLTGIQPEKISDFGARVAALLSELVGGLHHWDMKSLKRIDWTHMRHVEIVSMLPLATYDGNDLTRLVFLAHDCALRVSVQPASPQYVRLLFHARQHDSDDWFLKHPTLEQAVAGWRKHHPVTEIEGVKP